MDTRPKPIIFRISVKDRSVLRSLSAAAQCSEDSTLSAAVRYLYSQFLAGDPAALALLDSLRRPRCVFSPGQVPKD